MSRSYRLQAEHCLYHITSRGKASDEGEEGIDLFTAEADGTNESRDRRSGRDEYR